MIGKQFIQAQFRKLEENPRAWLKYVVVPGVILFSLGVAIAPPDAMSMLLMLPLAVVGIAVVLLFLRYPALGMPGLVLATMLLPTPFMTGQLAVVSSVMLLEGLLLGIWILDMVTRQRNLHLVRSRTNMPLVIFLLVALVALVNGQIKYYSFSQLAPITAQLSTLFLFVLSAGAFWLTGNLVKDTIWLQRMIWLFLGLSALYILGRIIPGGERYVYSVFVYGSDASLFWIWLVAMASSQLLLNRQLSRRVQIALAALLAGTIYVSMVVAYSWKSGWLPAMIGLAVIIFVGMPRLRVVAVLIGVLVLVLGYTKIDTAITSGEDYSLITRSEAWRLVLEIVKANPILGLGLANYYWYTPLFPIQGYRVNYNSHNNFIDLIAQVGLIGLGVFLWFAAEVSLLAWKLKEAVPDGFARAYVIGALGGLAGTLATGMLGDWFLPFVYNVGLHGYNSSIFAWLFLGGLVSLEQIYLNKTGDGSLEGAR